MKIKKQFIFSGIFKKLNEEDTHPLEITNANIRCYTNGMVLIEVNSTIKQRIHDKKIFETASTASSDAANRHLANLVTYVMNNNLQAVREEGLETDYEVKKRYEGDYGIEGETTEGLKIKAVIAEAGFKITVKADDTKSIEEEVSYPIKLKNLYINHNLYSEGEGKVQEVVYGLGNIEILHNFSAKIENSETELHIESVPSDKSLKISGFLSAEMTIKNVSENEQCSYENYCAWLISLLSLASGHCVVQVYEIKTIQYKNSLIGSEYWSGRELFDEARGIAVIQLPDLESFIKQCAKKLNRDIFIDRGLGLGLSWYIETFRNNVVQVNFVLLCTVLETLKSNHFNFSSSILLETKFYNKIVEEILQTLSIFEKEVGEDELEKYHNFTKKFKITLTDNPLNRLGTFARNLKEMFDDYGVAHGDLYPEKLDFVKTRNNLIHGNKGSDEENLAPALHKLSTLIVRVFLALLGYEGRYMESRKIEINDQSGYSRHGFICRNYPLESSNK